MAGVLQGCLGILNKKKNKTKLNQKSLNIFFKKTKFLTENQTKIFQKEYLNKKTTKKSLF